MSDNDVNDVNDLNSDGQECSSCDGGGGDDADEPCCGSGNSHKQADLKMLVFVLVLILAGAVAAHSIMNKDKGGSVCGSGQVEEGAPGGCCPADDKADADAAVAAPTPEDGAAGGCPFSGKTKVPDDAAAGGCPTDGQAEEAK